MSPEDVVHHEDTHRYIAGLEQLARLFGQPTDEERPPTPDAEDATPERIDDAELEAEVAELEDELEI